MTSTTTGEGAAAVRYEVDLSLRDHHLVRVTVHVPADLEDALLVLPTWTPGSYVVRDYAHHVQRVDAFVDGIAAEVTDPELSTWGVPAHELGAETRIVLEIYGHDLTVRTNHVDDHHALLVPAATFPAVEGARDRRHEVTIDVPAGQRAWGLLPTGDDDATFVADDYLHLVDGAFDVGDFPHAGWTTAGVAHELVFTSHAPAPDLDVLVADAARITSACVDLFDGHLPAPRYTFLLQGQEAGGGGLEHRDGSVLQMPVLSYRDPDRYARFQSLLCHEYLHLWNVKRLTPAELVRPDLQHPTRTSMLWVAEGWTAYYDELLPTRAGVWTVDRWRRTMAEVLQSVIQRPGALQQSVAQASRESWIKAYVRDENSSNVGVDYYSHGAMLAFLLDLLVRDARPESGGLDEVFRLLWRRFGSDDPDRPGYTSDDVQAAVEEVAGRDLDDVFQTYVHRAALPPVDQHLHVVGLRLGQKSTKGQPAWLGASVEEKGDETTLTSVLRDGPAWQAGLSGGDRVVAIDGVRLGAGDLTLALQGRDAGSTVDVLVLRGSRVLTRSVTLDAPRATWRLVPVQSPTERQRAVHLRWSGQDL